MDGFVKLFLPYTGVAAVTKANMATNSTVSKTEIHIADFLLPLGNTFLVII